MDDVKAGIVGAVVGDAVGVPVEFFTRERLQTKPVKGMQEFGIHNQPKGTWSDDSSMLLATVASLTQGVDYQDLMDRFVDWWEHDAYTPHDVMFGIGVSTERAITRYNAGQPPLESGGTAENDNGNGSLMRILPVVYYLRKEYGNEFTQFPEAFALLHEYSDLTHAHPRTEMACGLYLSIANELLNLPEQKRQGDKGLAITAGLKKARDFYHQFEEFQPESAYFARIYNKFFSMLPEREIRSSGYVVDTLEAAIWSFMNGHTFEQCILTAVNLGEDTDTVACVAGGLAGIYYGYDEIPQEWLDDLARKDWILDLCENYQESLEG
ncbi:MAG: ADP-ribosylglycohydrolase family protein [Enterococcaceae bacterium]|nr:ADP-ribosylglycohydrolase family protein [Enterococcaceae bacterium]MCI1918772.1 ADP-ribosylglycohydrolase family protein [Enterococcaceae bacterium]